MKTRIIHTKVWKDEWFSKLSKDAKLLWLYLLTCDKINISGVFELSDREILFDTSIDTSIDTNLILVKEELKPKAIFYKGWVRILNIEKYNKYLNSPLNIVACITELSYIPEDVAKELQIPTDTSIYTLRNKESEIRNKESGITNKESKEEKEVRLRKLKEETYQRLGWKLN